VSGLSTGLGPGINSGVKGGLGLSNLRKGLLNGNTNGTFNNGRSQNPLNLLGVKAPLIFYTADNIPIDLDGTNTSTVLTNLASGFNPLYESSKATLTFNSATTPIPQNAVFNTKATVDHTSASKFITISSSWNLAKQASFTFVCKTISNTTAVILQKGTSGASAIRISFEGGNRVQVSFTDASVNSIIYGSKTGSIIIGNYYLVTVIIDYSKPQGFGSEVKIFINGKEDTNYLSGSFNGSNGDLFAETTIIGAIGSGTLGGTHIASSLIFEYGYSTIERIRIENYFRSYYGFNF
jgi:hypothetical protein